MHTKRDLTEKAIKFCIPALEKAINNFERNVQYTVIDRVGFEPTQLEELLRPLWGIAPVLENKDNIFEIDVCGEKRELCSEIRRVVSEGTDEASKKCFSRNVTDATYVRFANQSITEFAGYMLALRLAPKALWEPYTIEEKNRIASWVKKWAVAALKDSWPNNHYWFPILSIIQLEKMGYDCGEIDEYMQIGFSELESLYIGDGWYEDGCFGRFDYYEAWSLHTYPAFYVLMSEGTRFYDEHKVDVYRERTEKFLRYYTHAFDSSGAYVAFGRSLAYRFAATAIFGAASVLNCNIDYGLARRIVFKNIEWFETNMIAEADGVLSPGYLYNSPQLVENYTSSGGAYWASKAFLPLAIANDHPFWSAEESLLPSEKGNYLITTGSARINMPLQCSADYSGVTLFNNTSTYFQEVMGNFFNDMASYYSKFCYNSRSGFAVATPDRPSYDNNFVLFTPDLSMYSTRKRMFDMGYVDGVLISEHKPFYNDSETAVKSWVVPLYDGYHIRAHRVTLSQKYIVGEGGFSVGAYNDENVFDITDRHCSVKSSSGLKSSVSSVATCRLNFSCEEQQPGSHILAPISFVPAYNTDILEPGVYYFASVFFFTSDKVPDKYPEISLKGSMLSLCYKEITKTINLEM